MGVSVTGGGIQPGGRWNPLNTGEASAGLQRRLLTWSEYNTAPPANNQPCGARRPSCVPHARPPGRVSTHRIVVGSLLQAHPSRLCLVGHRVGRYSTESRALALGGTRALAHEIASPVIDQLSVRGNTRTYNPLAVAHRSGRDLHRERRAGGRGRRPREAPRWEPPIRCRYAVGLPVRSRALPVCPLDKLARRPGPRRLGGIETLPQYAM